MFNCKINVQNLIVTITTSNAFRQTIKMNDADWWGPSVTVGDNSFPAPSTFLSRKKVTTESLDILIFQENLENYIFV